VREDVPVGLGHRLPETVQIRVSGKPRRARRASLSRGGRLSVDLNRDQGEKDEGEHSFSHGSKRSLDNSKPLWSQLATIALSIARYNRYSLGGRVDGDSA
jgi:hypothetical protein